MKMSLTTKKAYLALVLAGCNGVPGQPMVPAEAEPLAAEREPSPKPPSEGGAKEDAVPVPPEPSEENFWAAMERNDLEEGKRLLTKEVLYKILNPNNFFHGVLDKIRACDTGNEDAWGDLFLEHPDWLFHGSAWVPLAAESGDDDDLLAEKFRNALKACLREIIDDAVMLGDAEKAKRLMEKVYPGVYDARGWTPLQAAVVHGKTEVALAIYQFGDEYYQNQQGDTALHFAAEQGNMVFVSRFAARCVRNGRGETPLIAACKNNQTEAALKLMEFSLDQVTDQGWTAWHYAVKHKNYELMHALGEAGANPNIRTPLKVTEKPVRNLSALEYACWGVKDPDPEVVQCVIENGGNPDILMEDGRHHWDLAKQIENRELREAMLGVLRENKLGLSEVHESHYARKMLERRKKKNGKPYIFKRHLEGWK